MLQDEIKFVDDFFPIMMQRQLIADFLGPNLKHKWVYMPMISFNPRKDMFDIKYWSKNNLCEDTEGFVLVLDFKDEQHKLLVENIKHFAKVKFNTTINNILRMNIVYLPANTQYNENYHMFPHIDTPEFPHKNLLYYFYDNDAETIFFNQKFENDLNKVSFEKQEIIKKIKPKQGRAAMFDGWIFHAGAVSKINKRVTLNINFV